MNCSTCKENKIGPKTMPYGGFLCNNEHLQCNDCNTMAKGQCGICEVTTEFVQINFNPCADSFAAPANKIAPSVTPLSTKFDNMNYLFAEIEKQTSLSQEHLSMYDSKASIHQHISQKDGNLNLSKLPQEKSINKHLSNDEQDSRNLINLQSSNSKITGTMEIQKQVEPLNDHHLNMESAKNSAENFTCSFHNGNLCKGHDYNVEGEKHRNLKNFKESDLKENVFLFEENDPEDSKIIHTPEIRFLDSTDSIKNIRSNNIKTSIPEDMKPILSEQKNHDQQLEALSQTSLQDFEAENTGNSTDVVENYLRTYGPICGGYYQFPVYNCQHSQCDYGRQQQMQNMVMAQKKNVCISTDSEPSLKNMQIINPINLPSKLKPKDYLIMQSIGAAKPDCNNIALADKFDRPSLDMRMQKVLETFQEDPKIHKTQEKSVEPQSKGNYIKMLHNMPPKLQEIPEPLENAESLKDNLSNEISVANTNRLEVLQLLNTHRAYYNPPDQSMVPVNNLHTLAQPVAAAQEPPNPQFKIVPCSTTVIPELIRIKSRILYQKPLPAYMLNIPRSPIKCPESTCQRMIFVSDFNKHLVVDHNHLSMERITPFQCKNFFLDPRLAHCGVSKCHLLYLLRDKISDLGSSTYKDYLPVLIMTSWLSLKQMCGSEHMLTSKDSLGFLIIWITGIVSKEFPISVSLTIWPRSGKVPSCHLVYSGEMYSIRESQQALDVWQSGRMLLLSSQELKLLTNGGKDMLNLQLVVH